MLDIDSLLCRTLQIDLPRGWADLSLNRGVWRGGSAGAGVLVVWSFEFQVFPYLSAATVGGLGFEFYVFVIGWRHALRSKWHYVISSKKTSACLVSYIGQ